MGTAASTLKPQRRAVAINVHGASTAVQDPSRRNRKITSDAIFHIVGTFGVCMSHLWARWGVGGWGGNAWLELSWKHVPKGLERKRKDTQSVDAAVQVCQFIHLVNRVGPFYRTHGSCRVPPSQPPFPPGPPPNLPSPRRSCFTRPHNAIWNKCSVGSLTASKLQQWSGKEKRILKKKQKQTPDMWDHPMIFPNLSRAFQNA